MSGQGGGWEYVPPAPRRRAYSGRVVVGGFFAFALFIAVLGALTMVFVHRPPSFDLRIENTTATPLEELSLVTANGDVVEVGTVGASATETDDRVKVLGKIHYQLRYTVDGTRYVSRRFYSEDTKLFHKFAGDASTGYLWLPPSIDGYDGHLPPPGYRSEAFKGRGEE